MTVPPADVPLADVPLVDVSPDEWRIVLAILCRHVPDREVWAFGSRARHSGWTYSDLDLAIITDTPLPWTVYSDMAEAFSESDLPFRVDILDWSTTEENFRRIVEKDRVVVQPAARS